MTVAERKAPTEPIGRNGAASGLEILGLAPTPGAPFETFPVFVTPELAEAWLKQSPFPDQRTAAPDKVLRYATDMERGLFLPTTAIQFALLPDGTIILLDAQHRFHAAIAAGQGFWATCVVHPVADLQEAGILYGSIDGGAKRSLVQRLVAYGIRRRTQMNRTQVRRAAAAAALLMTGFQNPHKGEADLQTQAAIHVRDQVVSEWAPWFSEYFALIHGCNRNMRQPLERQAVMAVFVVALRYHHDKTRELIHSIATTEGLFRGKAAHTLAQFLLDYDTRSYPVHVYARYVASGITHHLKGDNLRLIKVLPQAIARPIEIGIKTPYDGKTVRRVEW